MSALDIILAPSPVLYKKTDFIVEIDKVVRKLSQNMFDTMYKFNGVGLAAPQVGKSIKMLVIDCSKTDENFFPKTLINPKILEISDILVFKEEGCLSFPNQFYEVERPDYVKVEYLDIDGKENVETFIGFESICVQHEIDHLNGVLFVDHMSKLRKNIILRKMKKFKKNLPLEIRE